MEEFAGRILKLIQKSKTEEALNIFIDYAKKTGNKDLGHLLSLMLSQFNADEEKEMAGTSDQDRLQLNRNRINENLLKLLKEIREGDQRLVNSSESRPLIILDRESTTFEEVKKPIAIKREKGMSVKSFRQLLFGLLIASKVVIYIALFTLWQSGGLFQTQYFQVLGMISPIFVTHLMMMIRFFMQNQQEDLRQKQNMGFGWLWGILLTFMSYVVLLLIGGFIKGSGDLDYESFLIWIGGIETALGGIIGYVISALFSKAERTAS